jgi:signal peptide peptidase SppA
MPKITAPTPWPGACADCGHPYVCNCDACACPSHAIQSNPTTASATRIGRAVVSLVQKENARLAADQPEDLPARAIPPHHTATSDDPWEDQSSRIPDDAWSQAKCEALFAYFAGGNPEVKSNYAYEHHFVNQDGSIGAASTQHCSDHIGVLNGGRAGPGSISETNRHGVWDHLATHLRDAHKGEEDYEPPPLKGTSMPVFRSLADYQTRRRYSHVLQRVFDVPWALEPSKLREVAAVVSFRANGGHLGSEEIERRLAAAAQFNGDRTGGGTVGPVAIIPIYGTISQRMSLMTDMSGGTSVEALRADLDDALADKSIAAIVFDIDSPGGSTDGMPEFAAYLRSVRGKGKPIVACVNTLCASAAYWIASQCDRIICTASGEVGSIGVFAAHEDDSEALEMQGVTITLVSAGPYKTELSSYAPLSDDARANLQDQIDTFYGMFLGDVARGRGTTPEAVAAGYGGGRTLLAAKAKAAGMVDGIDTLEGTVRALLPKATDARTASRFAPGALAYIHQGEAVLAPAAIAAPTRRSDREWNQRMQRRHRR